MVNGKLVFEHNPDKYFCKNFSMDNEHIYIVGGVRARDVKLEAWRQGLSLDWIENMNCWKNESCLVQEAL